MIFYEARKYFFENKHAVENVYNQKRLSEIFQKNESTYLSSKDDDFVENDNVNVKYSEGSLEERYF